MEKLLKGALAENGRYFSRTHDLNHLLDLIVSEQPLWEAFRPSFQELASYAVEYRYPGESATKDVAHAALKAAKDFSAEFRISYGR